MRGTLLLACRALEAALEERSVQCDTALAEREAARDISSKRMLQASRRALHCMAVLAQQHCVLSEASLSTAAWLLVSTVCMRSYWRPADLLDLCSSEQLQKWGLSCRLAMTRSSDMLCCNAMLMP